MPSLPLTMLDEYYINYAKIESPIFRISGKLKTIKSYKITSFQKLREFLEDKKILVYSLIHEEYENENGENVPFYVLNAHINEVTPDPNMPFITDEDTKFAILSYVVNSMEDDDVAIESIAIGDTSMELAINSVVETYRKHKDFKLIRDADRLIFREIVSY